jgi:hypothetical protein
MTTAVLASSYLGGSIMTLLVPVAVFIAIAIWGVWLVRRHERHRDDHLEASGRAAAGPDAAVAAATGTDAAHGPGSAGAG